MNLSPLGHQHAADVAEWFGEHPLDAVYVSPMKRAQQTAAPLLAARQITPSIVDALREVDFGDWTGSRWHEIQEKFGVDAYDWLEVMEKGAVPNGESALTLANRLRPAVQSILNHNADRSVAIVCHGGIIRGILSLLLELPLSFTSHMNIDYGSVTMLELQPAKKHIVEIELLNFCPGTDRIGPRALTSERSSKGLRAPTK